jgi:two-component system sensor kinase FixL
MELFLSWSKGAEKLYGWTSSEAVGQISYNLFKTRFPEPLKDIESQVKTSSRWTGELRHTTKEGCDIIVQSWWLAQKDEHSELINVLESNVDITERKHAEQKLQDAERLAAIGATAGMVGHDIRNPLQAITGDVYLAKTELASITESAEKNSIQESLTEIEKNIDYINKIVQDLQDYARPLNPKAEEIDLKLIIADLLAKQRLPDNIELNLKIENKAEKISADSYYINRIMYNLVTNAVQAMPKGGRLTIHALRGPKDLIMTVKDTGVGIPKDVQGKMFTLMFTTKAKGQGFGLPVVKRMIEALGGTITFESQEGKGTTFTVRIPYVYPLNR